MARIITVTVDLDRLATYAPAQNALHLLNAAYSDKMSGGKAYVWTQNGANVGVVDAAGTRPDKWLAEAR